MPTITKKSGGKKNLASGTQSPWQAIAGALERLGERESALLVLVQPTQSTIRTERIAGGWSGSKDAQH
jgi:hypothetical protein